jgi:hypothetical protein
MNLPSVHVRTEREATRGNDVRSVPLAMLTLQLRLTMGKEASLTSVALHEASTYSSHASPKYPGRHTHVQLAPSITPPLAQEKLVLVHNPQETPVHGR